MKTDEIRYMWHFLFFDLPVKTKRDRYHAGRFRRFLKNDGWDMLQLSVYARICRGEDGAEKHLSRVRAHLPPRGSVRVLTITDRQYGRMKFLVGQPRRQEKVAKEQLVLL